MIALIVFCTALVAKESSKHEHALKVNASEKVCPITGAKTNPDYSCVINGKTYEFCCLSCIDKFLTLAKEHPEEIMDPEFYVSRGT